MQVRTEMFSLPCRTKRLDKKNNIKVQHGKNHILLLSQKLLLSVLMDQVFFHLFCGVMGIDGTLFLVSAEFQCFKM